MQATDPSVSAPTAESNAHEPKIDIALHKDVPIPLRDNTTTFADIWRPTQHAAAPVILIRTPYFKEQAIHETQVDPQRAAARGFSVVYQDVRGRGRSQGAFDPFINEGHDGFDSIEWIASQSWCDGRVVMAGSSYPGAVQWLAAALKPPSLAAIAPTMMHDQCGHGWMFRNGVRELGSTCTWMATYAPPPEQARFDHIEEVCANPALVRDLAPWTRRWLDEPNNSTYWQARSAAHNRTGASIPALMISGWYDLFLDKMLQTYSESDNSSDRLIVGPWGHDDFNFSHVVGQRNLGGAGAGSIYDIQGKTLDFFDAVLAGRDPHLPGASVYVLERGEWINLNSWPPPTIEHVAHLGSGSMIVKPSDLPPARGGRALLMWAPGFNFGPYDQRPVADRDDVLAFHIETPPAGSLLAGPVKVHLDTYADVHTQRQWVAILCLQHADGAMYNLCESVTLSPPDAENVEIVLGDVCTTIPSNARLVVLISGGLFPRWEPIRAEATQRVHSGSITLQVADTPIP